MNLNMIYLFLPFYRGVFRVDSDVLCVPKLYSPITNCNVRVVDNDTGEELKTIFHKPAPATYKKNKVIRRSEIETFGLFQYKSNS